MSSDSSRTFWQLLPLYLACYALWLGLCARGGWLIVQARDTSVALAFWFRLNPWQLRAVDQFGVVTFGLIWLVAIFVIEHYLRQGVLKNRLWARATRVFLFEAVLLGIFYAVRALLA